METFEKNDWIALKPREELTEPSWKDQEIGMGRIIYISPHDRWVGVKWRDNSENSYYKSDLVLIQKGGDFDD